MAVGLISIGVIRDSAHWLKRNPIQFRQWAQPVSKAKSEWGPLHDANYSRLYLEDCGNDPLIMTKRWFNFLWKGKVEIEQIQPFEDRRGRTLYYTMNEEVKIENRNLDERDQNKNLGIQN